MGIELTEEPYDGPVATTLVDLLLVDLNERYADDFSELDEEAISQADADYLQEVTAADLRRPDGCFVVAWLDGEPVGCGALRRFVPYDGSDPPPLHAEIKRMYTAPVARRRGVGRLVLERLEEVAIELGYRTLVLETGTQQPEALALYRLAGWHEIEPYGHYRDSPFSVCFGKDLPAP